MSGLPVSGKRPPISIGRWGLSARLISSAGALLGDTHAGGNRGLSPSIGKGAHQASVLDSWLRRLRGRRKSLHSEGELLTLNANRALAFRCRQRENRRAASISQNF